MAERPSTPSTVVDALIADLETDGVHRGGGHFTLDRAIAREKVARFALPDPEDYVLMLVRSAVRQGATQIHLRVDADDLWMESNGRPFTRRELEGMYDALLDAQAPGGGGMRELSTALVTARSLDLRYATVTTGGQGDGIAMALRSGEPEAFEPVTLDHPGTTVHVKRALSAQVVSRQASELAGVLPEEARLRVRCRFADIGIEVNGRPLPRGPVGADLEALVDVEGPGVDGGVAGFKARDNDTARVLVMRDGVWIDRIELPALLPGFEAVVVADGLRTDLTGFQVVQDDDWSRVMEHINRAHRQCLRELAETFASPDGFPPSLHSWAQGLLRRSQELDADTDAWLRTLFGAELEGLDAPAKRAAAAVPRRAVEQRRLNFAGVIAVVIALLIVFLAVARGC